MSTFRLVSATLFIAIRSFGQCNPHPLHPDLRDPCPTIADQLSKAFDAARDFNSKVAQLNTSIDAARRRYWAAFTNGPDVNTAEKEFMNALWTKDMYYMHEAVWQNGELRTCFRQPFEQMRLSNAAPWEGHFSANEAILISGGEGGIRNKSPV
jgi:hypothetical protein